MKISSATANSLGEKLAGLDLSEEEGVLLASLLDAADGGDEVAGFGYTEVEWTYGQKVLGPLPSVWKPEKDSYMKIEWT